jgi:Holliday junction resolvasome RuvABC endonuclease subunit
MHKLSGLISRVDYSRVHDTTGFANASRQQVKVHINRALRARAVEQKHDEIALAIGELARYVEDIEKDELSRSSTR